MAAAAACLVVLVVPRGGDLAAHLYRTGLVRHGILIWDNLWFGGQYPLTSYSLLYYPLAALAGNAALGIGGVVLGAVLFSSVAEREWQAAARWPARAYAVLLSGQAFTGAYPFVLGLSMLLATLWALQRRRLWLAVPCVLLTLGFSPLAFLFLALVLVAVFLRRGRVTAGTVVVGGAATVAGALQLVLLVLLPTPGLDFPYSVWWLLAGLAVAAFGVALSLRGRAGWPLAAIFVVWSVASIVAALTPSPVGRNILRASVFAFPLMLVAARLADWRPRKLAIAAVAAALAANVLPYMAMIPDRSSSADSRAAFWQPLIAYLHAHDPPAFRVEVVETANHWENYFLPRAGIALARGWYVQLDMADNRTLYLRRLTGPRYRAWLRARAVRYVVLPHLPSEARYGGQEARLLESGRSGLHRVWTGAHMTVYALPHATPLLTGPGAAAITRLGSSRIAGRVARPGNYVLRVRFNPYWRIARGSLCLAAAGGGTTLLHAVRAGPFAIQAIETPDGLISALVKGRSQRCGGER